VSISSFTSRQRLVLILMLLMVIVVFAILAGFVVTYKQMLEGSPPNPSSSAFPTPLPATPTPSPVPTAEAVEGVWSPVQAARLLDQIEHQVETMRALSPRAEVPLNFLDRQEMLDLLDQLYAERDPEERLLPYVALGVLPDVPVPVHPRDVTGLYVAEQGQLYVATGGRGGSADDQAVLAHAYAHALQDQHFDLEEMEDRAATTDAALAARALIEGDAMLLTALYRYGDMAAADWLHLEELILQAEQPGYGADLEASDAWARLQLFPYREGRFFAAAIFRAGGWDSVDQAYIAPPRSTEQVLHIERYLEQRDPPVPVNLPHLGAILGQGWTLLVQDTLGELVAGLYLDRTLAEETAWRAVDGWGGDTFVVWEREDGARVRVWRTVWDNTAEAVEFERALVALIPQRYLPVRPMDPPSGMPGQWWDTGTGAIHVSRVARYVTFVYAPNVNTLINVVGVLP